jgi:hypothetical protein
MAQSRGTGLGRPKPGGEDKPLLDGEKLATLKGKIFVVFFKLHFSKTKVFNACSM